uniref:Uncharacterized protein n=1 Tax=Rhizophora mucronata TaxID=61149 RepID=A0A2P2JHD1_RHIMU
MTSTASDSVTYKKNSIQLAVKCEAPCEREREHASNHHS